jgi:hypothetical protein
MMTREVSASLYLTIVMAGLVPAIHVDPRVKPGDDILRGIRLVERDQVGWVLL